MKTIKSTLGGNRVEIKNISGNFSAKFFTSFNDGEHTQDQLLEMKSFNSEKSATKWAHKVLA